MLSKIKFGNQAWIYITLITNKYELLKSLEAHIENNTKCIDDVAIVRVLEEEEASNYTVKNFRGR